VTAFRLLSFRHPEEVLMDTIVHGLMTFCHHLIWSLASSYSSLSMLSQPSWIICAFNLKVVLAAEQDDSYLLSIGG
jgi:hypothetical protein